MFVNLRCIRKVQLARLLVTLLVLGVVSLCWEELDHHIVSHVRSYTYRYLYNRYDFLNQSTVLASRRSEGRGRGKDTPPLHRYLMNPERKCAGPGGGDILLLLFVKSSPQNALRRQNIRQTWGDERYVKENLRANVRVLFALGVHPDDGERSGVQRNLEAEYRLHRDLVQQDFNDTFHNLTTKLILQFHWATAYCPVARFVMTADDDVFVHVPNLVRYLRTVEQQHQDLRSTDREQKGMHFWAGHVHRGAPPIRRKDNKYFVSVELYPWPAYPDYTSGAGYVVSRDAAARIHGAMQTLNTSMYIDDVFMGMCAAATGLEPQDNVFFAGEGTAPSHPCIYARMLTSHGHADDMIALWRRATDPGVRKLSEGALSRLYCAAARAWLLCLPHYSTSYQCKAAFT